MNWPVRKTSCFFGTVVHVLTIPGDYKLFIHTSYLKVTLDYRGGKFSLENYHLYSGDMVENFAQSLSKYQ